MIANRRRVPPDRNLPTVAVSDLSGNIHGHDGRRASRALHRSTASRRRSRRRVGEDPPKYSRSAGFLAKRPRSGKEKTDRLAGAQPFPRHSSTLRRVLTRPRRTSANSFLAPFSGSVQTPTTADETHKDAYLRMDICPTDGEEQLPARLTSDRPLSSGQHLA
jgi:hypothetical protein